MSTQTKIEWCDSTFNPWIGCTKISPACDNCYAEADFDLRRHRVKWGAGQERSRTSSANWKLPIRWNAQHWSECQKCGWRGHYGASDAPCCGRCGTPTVKSRRRVFCASLADVFDNEVPTSWRAELFQLIADTPDLDWLLLTKRVGNAEVMIMDTLRSMFNQSNIEPPTWPFQNVWLGATVCNQTEADRDIPKLLAVPAAKRFLSMEPLLGPVDLRFHIFSEPTGNFRSRAGKRQMELHKPKDGGLHWVIVGGESGPHARPMHPKWVRRIRDQCADAGVPFFMKQWGEWIPRSSCYHKFTDGMSCVDIDPGATKWPCFRLNENGGNGNLLDDEDGGDSVYMQRVGKAIAGRHIDGRTWEQFP